MQAFNLLQPSSLDDAIAAASSAGRAIHRRRHRPLQLMKDNVEVPTQLVDLERCRAVRDRCGYGGLRLGAMARMSDVAAHPAVREHWPVISERCWPPPRRRCATWAPSAAICCSGHGAAISATLVSSATNVSPAPAVRRSRARTGCWRSLGQRSMHRLSSIRSCRGADGPRRNAVDLHGADGAERQVPIADFYRLPGDTPDIETVLAPGELIDFVTVPRHAGGA